MPDRDASAPAMDFALPAHFFEVHPGGVEVEIKMKIDVDVKTPSNGEDARYLLMRIGVGRRAATYKVGSTFASSNE